MHYDELLRTFLPHQQLSSIHLHSSHAREAKLSQSRVHFNTPHGRKMCRFKRAKLYSSARKITGQTFKRKLLNFYTHKQQHKFFELLCMFSCFLWTYHLYTYFDTHAIQYSDSELDDEYYVIMFSWIPLHTWASFKSPDYSRLVNIHHGQVSSGLRVVSSVLQW